MYGSRLIGVICYGLKIVCRDWLIDSWESLEWFQARQIENQWLGCDVKPSVVDAGLTIADTELKLALSLTWKEPKFTSPNETNVQGFPQEGTLLLYFSGFI